MTIHGLANYLSSQNLNKKETLDVLQGCKIGIDGYFWLKNLLEKKLEPFLLATGGGPLTLYKIVEQNLEKFKKAGIKPLFVFNGINCIKKERSNEHNVKKSILLKSAWNAYERDQKKEALMSFSLCQHSIVSTETIHCLLKYFNDNQIEYIRAPYLAWAQLGYLLENNLIHAIYADEECLMFDIPKLITNIDFDSQEFNYYDKKQILLQERLSNSQFLDASLLSGKNYFITKNFTKVPHTDISIEFEALRNYGSAMNHPSLGREESIHYFLYIKNMIVHHPILDIYNNGLFLLNQDQSPYDLEEVLGERLPDEIYFLISHGVIAPHLANNLITGVFYEPSPLLDSLEYRELINNWKIIYINALNYFTSELNDYFKSKQVSLIRYHSSLSDNTTSGNQQVESIIVERRSVNLFQEGIQYYMNDNNVLKYFQNLKLKPTNDCVNLNVVLNCKPNQLQIFKRNLNMFQSVNELKSYIHLKVLEVLGYVTNIVVKKGGNYQQQQQQVDMLSVKGKALSGAKIYQEQTLLLIELLKHLTQPFSKVDTLSKQTEKIVNEDEITLISRVLSTIPLTFKHSNHSYSGLIRQDLTLFYSLVKVLQTNITNLYEALLTATYTSRSILPENIPMIMPAMKDLTPFDNETGNVMGVLAWAIFTTPTEQLDKKFFNNTFNITCPSPCQDFRERAIPFWRQTVEVVRKLAKLNPNEYKHVLTKFEKANDVFEERIKVVTPILEQQS